jgi:hypothetical protein
MRQSAQWVIRAAVMGLAMIGGATSSLAQTYDLSSISNNEKLIFGNYTLTSVGNDLGCSHTNSNGFSATCRNSEVVGTIHRGVLSLVFQTIPGSGSAALASATAGYSGTMDFAFNVSEKIGNTIIPISQVALGITTKSCAGTSCGSTDLASITAKETVNNASSPQLSVSGASQNDGPVSVTGNSLSISKALAISNPSGSGVTLSLLTMTQRYYGAPEPISLSVFGAGLAGLALVRRKFRRA